MSDRETYIDDEGYRRPVNPPKPELITLTPPDVEGILYDMGWEEIDVESFIMAAVNRGVAR